MVYFLDFIFNFIYFYLVIKLFVIEVLDLKKKKIIRYLYLEYFMYELCIELLKGGVYFN